MLFLESDMLAVTISSPLFRYPLPSPRNMLWRSSISLEKWCCSVHLLKKVRSTFSIWPEAWDSAGLLKPQLHLPFSQHANGTLWNCRNAQCREAQSKSRPTLFSHPKHTSIYTQHSTNTTYAPSHTNTHPQAAEAKSHS